MYRDGVVRAVKSRPELELVGQVTGGREALAQIRDLRPDVAVCDMRMPDLEGTQIVTAVQREDLGTRVLLLSAHTESATVFDGISAGAAGFLSKDADAKSICEAITSVARGETVLDPELQHGFVGEVRRRGADSGPLSDREQEVLALIAKGLSTVEIAQRLHLSPTTIKTHMQNLYGKLGVSERAAAVAEGMRRGLVE